MKLLQIICSILIPPLGVFLTVGISSALLINVVLTLFGVLPGSIHAVWVLTEKSQED